MLIESLRVLGVLVAGAVFWLAYIDLKDRARPEPRLRILLAFLLGMGAAALAIAAFRGLDALGVSLDAADGPLQKLLFCVGAIGGVEEGAKFLVFFVFVRRWRACDEPIDGFVYAGTIGCGFATLENMLHLPSLAVAEQLARVAVLPITHALFAAVWGLALTRPDRTKRTVALALLLSVGLHGIYDFVVIVLDFPVASSLLVLAMWLTLLLRVRQLAPPSLPAGPSRSLARLLLTGLVVLVGLLAFAGLRPTQALAPRVWFPDGGVLGPVRGDVALQVHIADGGSGVGEVRVTVDGQRLKKSGGSWIWPSMEMEDGAHVLRVEAAGRGYRTKQAVRFGRLFSDNSPARILASRASTRPQQGGSFVLLLRPTEPVQGLRASWLGRPMGLHALPQADGTMLYRGLRGVGVRHPAGKEQIVLEFRDLDGRPRKQTLDIEIQATDFSGNKRVLNIPRKKRSLMTKPPKGTDQARRNAAYAYPIREQLWRGNHSWPTEGRRSSRFGKLRTYNTGVQRHHLGVDISNDPGTPIFASNDGIVILSERQRAFGHVVIVGHGHQLSTSYNHLLVPGVPRGTRVRKGDQVGLMGSTGLSTGPHLHWGMELAGIAVNAEEWLDQQFDGQGVDDFE
jgi:RsiW-degrading membrane proteinase PrsW (M82 family)